MEQHQGALSFWGWGFADRFADAETRKTLGSHLEAMLGFAPTELRDAPRLQDIELDDSRASAHTSLAAFVSAEPEARIRHTHGRAWPDIFRGFQGEFRPAPDLVATPRSEQEVAEVLDWANTEKISVIPWGGGTSVCGGVKAERGEGHRAVLALDLAALDQVLEVDERSMAARIQAGARGPQLEAQLASSGLTLRHFPQSFEFSTLGGWIATRAGGHFSTVYTHIDDLVESCRMLTPRGPFESRRLPASGAGPSPDRLVLGSEGSLGVITEAWMRVRRRPRFRASASVLFADYARAIEATRHISQSGLFPARCRLLDSREAALNFVTDDGSHVLMLGFESADHPLQAWLERALEICTEAGGRCPEGARYRDSADAESEAAASWRDAFIEAPYLQTQLISLGILADTFETACTWDRFEALHARVIRDMRAAMKSVCGAGRISCRFTHVYPDGPAPYYTFIAPLRPGAELEQWAALKQAAGDALLAEGGTITHHHAVGRTHRPWYREQRPTLFGELLSAVKDSLDPAGIMNPGALI